MYFSLFIFSGAIASFTTSLGSLFRESSKFLKYSSSFLFLSIGLYLLAVAIWLSPIRDEFISSQYFHFPCASTIGPLLYLYLQTILNEKWKFKRRHLLLFIPSIVFVAELIPFYLLPTEEKFRIRDAIDQGNTLSGFAYYLKLSRSFIFIQNLISILYFCFQTRILFNFKTLKSQNILIHFYILTRFTILSIFISLFFELFYHFDSYRVSVISLGSTITLIVYYLHVLIIKFPNGNRELTQVYSKIKYESSNLRNLDSKLLILKLENLMSEEKLYRDENLTMIAIAEKLNINKHQLSELLNASIGVNFYDYINKYRVIEAKKILEDSPEQIILRVAFDVGFKSQSTFYTAFKKVFKMTPADYKNNFHKHNIKPSKISLK